MVDMKKKLIIHIGTPKTGSSFLQKVCIKNYNKLLNLGVLYPGVENNSFVKKANEPINASHILACFSLDLDKDSLCKLIIEKLETVFSFDCPTVLISDETLSAFNVQDKGNLFIFECLIEACNTLNIDLSFIAYYRQPSRYLPSHWAQLVKKHQETRSLIQFAEQDYIPYWANLIALHSLYSKVIIYSYDEQAKLEKGISQCFFNSIGIDLELLENLENSSVNTSLSLNSLTALRLINAEFDHETINSIEAQLSKAIPKNKLNKPKLSKEMEVQINLLYEKELAKLSVISTNYK